MAGSFHVDMQRLTKKLSNLEKQQLPFAASLALNQLAVLGQKAAQRGMKQHLDKPTPFTIRGVRVIRSSKRKLISAVFIQNIQAEYLKYQIHGGTRMPKGRAIVVPVQQRLNQYGNLPRGKIKNLLARQDVFTRSNRPDAGIFQRKRGGRLKMLISFKSQARYNKRFPYEQIVIKEVKRYTEPAFRQAMAKAIATAR